MYLSIPGEPVAKGRPRFNTQTGRAYTDEKTAAHEELIGRAFQDRYPGADPLTGPITVGMTFYEGGRPKDLDNCAKTVLDALNGLAWSDDRQITRLYCDVVRGDPAPKTIVLIEESGDGT